MNIIKKTKNYDMFIFRADNRATISQEHVKRLEKSIGSRNLLELKPIVVNSKMEIIDGQHRLLAAKQLGVDIFYQVDNALKGEDIIALNVAKSWGLADYLNYYCQNNNMDYIQFREFIKNNGINIKIGINLFVGQTDNGIDAFKRGEFVYREEYAQDDIDMCLDTIGYIKKMNGVSSYTYSGKFWKALLKLIRHPSFILSKWQTNMEKMISNFGPRVTTKDYEIMLQNIYNWRENDKISLID